MLTPALSMLASESLLSLYPIFVKKIGLSLVHQVWTRLLAYVAMSAIFVDWGFIKSVFFSSDALILALINLSHIFFSYEGFRNLDSGVSFAIFNTYPLMILLIAGVMWNNVYLLVLLGLALFVLGEARSATGTKRTAGTTKERSSQSATGTKRTAGTTKERSSQSATGTTKRTTAGTLTAGLTQESPANFIYGLAMILFAALTEALIYFMVRRIKTDNHWNHVFLSYMMGFIAISGYLFSSENDFGKTMLPRMSLAIGLNGFIGSVAYFLRFFAASNLAASIFAPLAYFGMVMSYVYGIVFNDETLSWEKVGGTLCILAANYWAPRT
jgi:drug/metabolite transporter (DMT)-like permease